MMLNWCQALSRLLDLVSEGAAVKQAPCECPPGAEPVPIQSPAVAPGFLIPPCNLPARQQGGPQPNLSSPLLPASAVSRPSPCWDLPPQHPPSDLAIEGSTAVPQADHGEKVFITGGT